MIPTLLVRVRTLKLLSTYIVPIYELTFNIRPNNYYVFQALF